MDRGLRAPIFFGASIVSCRFGRGTRRRVPGLLVPRHDTSEGIKNTIATMALASDPRPPLLFLDIDDVICVNDPYGGLDVISASPPPDLHARLFHRPAVEALLAIVQEHRPVVVMTTSWIRVLDRAAFHDLFLRTGLAHVARAFHPVAWHAPAAPGQTRLQAIDAWLASHHRGEALVVLDDSVSGTGLAGSHLDAAGRVVLCELRVGLHAGHLDVVRRAL